MRTMAVNTLVLALVLACGGAAFGQPAAGGEQQPKGPNQGPNPPSGPGTAPANAAKPVAPSTLEEMLAQAAGHACRLCGVRAGKPPRVGPRARSSGLW